MRNVKIIHHRDPTGWWAESPDVPELTAGGATYGESREMAEGGVRLFLQTEQVEVEHYVPEGSLPSAA